MNDQKPARRSRGLHAGASTVPGRVVPALLVATLLFVAPGPHPLAQSIEVVILQAGQRPGLGTDLAWYSDIHDQQWQLAVC